MDNMKKTLLKEIKRFVKMAQMLEYFKLITLCESVLGWYAYVGM